MLAKFCGIFVDCETGPVGRKLEQHSAGLEKIHRLEPEPIDHFGGPAPRALDAFTYDQLRRNVGDPPRHVMDAADASPATLRVGNLANLEILPRPAASQTERSPLVLDT
jgi:hypothetical protein